MDELQDIMNEFVDEATEVLSSVMVDLMDLERGYDDETVHRVYRAFHSVKGNSGMLGLERLSALAHKAEDALSLVRDRRLEPSHEVVSLLLRAVDVMTSTLEDVRCGLGDGRDAGEVRQSLEELVQRHGGPKPKKRPPAAVECLLREKELAASSAQELPIMDAEPETPRPAPKAPKIHPAAPATASPQHEAPRPTASVSLGRQKMAPLISESRGALRILVVEDDFSARQILMDFFGQFGTCHVAKDGLEAIHAFIQGHDVGQPYHLICMDIKMPVMDGLTAARTMREIERGKGINGAEGEAILVITSSVEDPVAIIKACYECGANYYFLKPLDMAQVRRQLFKMGLAALMDGV
jgi:two-component system chemotaxis response regulator CheY